LTFALLIALVVTIISNILRSIKSRMVAFWHRLTWAVLEHGH